VPPSYSPLRNCYGDRQVGGNVLGLRRRHYFGGLKEIMRDVGTQICRLLHFRLPDIHSLKEDGAMLEHFRDDSQRTGPSRHGLAHLLLVDDDPALLEALSGTIQSRLGQCSLDTCDSGMKALDLVRSNGYDTIIVDVNMPKMDGLKLLSAVKQLRPDTPVLMMTAYADDTIMAQAFEAGALDFLAKPFDRGEFVLAVEEGLELARLQSVAGNLAERHRRTSEKIAHARERIHQHTLTKLKDRL
jgi:CheY-like chemotaxis protein